MSHDEMIAELYFWLSWLLSDTGWKWWERVGDRDTTFADYCSRVSRVYGY